jgi:predicted Rossmann fold nucleotide-binding protein DprA/Smf involved in DNA uptake
LRENKIGFKILEDKDYPENLKRIENPALVFT